ncbi:hypothetical protein GH810_07175 [Acetobacterium paludosum]|uniref:2-isopropylmalate synthase/homocitrate synthase post-catalytic domain-containing protein n=1 Tax=Acetobacterium paludosum TaxID=52693 RepID=A0A923I0Z2_9FIRM|nr:hypothetical protein [Acetobacterium paludosum]MBC3888088.1 hypothetical protein [Acetobacterium paludosum]
MVTIIDRTLTTLDTDRIDAQDLNHFCTLLFTCGVTKVELPYVLTFRLKPLFITEDAGKRIDTDTCFLKQNDDHSQMPSWKLEPNELVEKAILPSQMKNLRNKKIRIVGWEDLITRDYLTIFQELLNNSAHTLDLCPSNKMHCATAIALEWILAGGTSVSCAFANYHDFPRLEEVLMGLKLRDPSSYKGDLSVLSQLKVLYEKITSFPISKTKAIIGEDIFKVESGIHVDGVIKNPTTYEPFNPKTVGSQREIVLGKHSGQQSVLYKLREQNLSETAAKSILKQIKEGCTQLGRNISDLELQSLVREVKNDYEPKIYC